MDNQQQQETQQTPEPPKPKWIITDHQADFLRGIREALIEQRAYEILNMSQEHMFSAAQANGFSRGRLALIDELLADAQVIHTDTSLNL
jgi:hypothetical protein